VRADGQDGERGGEAAAAGRERRRVPDRRGGPEGAVRVFFLFSKFFFFLLLLFSLSSLTLFSIQQKKQKPNQNSGPGDFLGAKQSGWGVVSQGLRAARLPDDIELLPRAREAALALVEALPFGEGGGEGLEEEEGGISAALASWPRSLARAVEEFEARTTALSAATEAALGSKKGAGAAAAALPLEEPKKAKRATAAAAKKAPAAAAAKKDPEAPARRRGRPPKAAQQQQ
jgi:hypothetical protein